MLVKKLAGLLVSIICFGLMSAAPSLAQTIETNASFAYMVDADTGAVLLDKDAKQAMNPSSMSKLMTLYVLFEELESGRVSLTDTFRVSEKAWKMGGSKMFVHMQKPVTVEDLLRGIIVQSGNDACIVVAENIAGSEEAFASRLNQTAQRIGLEHSHFVNATGWPHPDHVMSSSDIVKLSKAIINDFPEYYHYFAEQEFTYNKITQQNRNRLIGGTLGVDGLKTGHTEIAGYGIVLSAKDENTARRVVLVVNGLDSKSARVEEGAKLLSWGLNAFENKQLVSKGHVIGELPVWFGASDSVSFTADEDFTTTILKGGAIPLKANIKAALPIPASNKKGDEIGTLLLESEQGISYEIPLTATESVEQAKGLRWFVAMLTQYIAPSN